MDADDNARPPLPWYGVDAETGEQHFGPVRDKAEAQQLLKAHPRREHIELRRHPTGR